MTDLRFNRNFYHRLKIVEKPFPQLWQQYLEQHVPFYKKLSLDEKILFDQRTMIFISEKRIEGVETYIDDNIKLLVAASAIIPTFAFPLFEYPSVHEVLIYPNAFNEAFESDLEEGETRNIIRIPGRNISSTT